MEMRDRDTEKRQRNGTQTPTDTKDNVNDTGDSLKQRSVRSLRVCLGPMPVSHHAERVERGVNQS